MKRSTGSKKVVRAIALGLAAMITVTSVPVTTYAEVEPAATTDTQSEGGNNDGQGNVNQESGQQKNDVEITVENCLPLAGSVSTPAVPATDDSEGKPAQAGSGALGSLENASNAAAALEKKDGEESLTPITPGFKSEVDAASDYIDDGIASDPNNEENPIANDLKEDLAELVRSYNAYLEAESDATAAADLVQNLITR